MIKNFLTLLKKERLNFIGHLLNEESYQSIDTGKTLTFYTTVTGDQFARIYLGVLLQSIDEIYRGSCNVVVGYSDLSRKLLQTFHQKLPYVKWLKSPSGKPKAKLHRDRAALKLKTGWWPFLSRMKNTRLVLMDADMLVLKDISHFFDDHFDVGYTYFDNHFTPFGDASKTQSGKHTRLNTGIVLVKHIDNVLGFFRNWTNITLEILKKNNLKLIEEWGAADQAALAVIINTDDHSQTICKDGVVLKGIACRDLNETECRPISKDTCVIHYKGRWRPVLPDGTWDRLTEEQRVTRNETICAEQYYLWRSYFDRWNCRQ
jgi:hypothetical protein